MLELMPFQEQGVIWMLSKLIRRPGVILADEMGLGKTIQAITVCDLLHRNSPDGIRVLVVCPKSVMQSWIGHMAEYDFSRTVINYDVLKKHEADFIEEGFDVVIYDEAHRLKESRSQRTKSAMKIAASVKSNGGAVILLTGTPIPNYLYEIFTLLKICGDTFGYNRADFEKKFCNARFVNRFGIRIWDNKGCRNIDEFNANMANIMLRRKVDEVLPDMPDTIEELICLNKVNEDKDSMFIAAIKSLSDVNTLKRDKGQEFYDSFMEERRMQALAKVDDTVEYVTDMLDGNKEPIVIFAHHREVQNALYLKLVDKFKVRTISGSDTLDNRKRNVDDFQKGNVDILIVSITAGGEGITLTKSRICLFVELPFVPAQLDQAIARLRRIGQKSSVLVKYILRQGSLDAHIAKLLLKKKEIINKLVV